MARMSKERGLTLIELMVVVVLVGVMAALASGSIASDRDVSDLARQLRDGMRESSRMASASGPVPIEAVAEGESALVRFTVWGDGTSQFGAVQVFQDTGSGWQWDTVRSFAVRSDFEITGYSIAPDISGGSGPGTTLGLSSSHSIDCNSRGSCEPATFYIYDKNKDKKMRVVTMPMAGNPSVYGGW